MRLAAGLLALLLLGAPWEAGERPELEVLHLAAETLGVEGLHSIRYTGSGVTYRLGQSFSPGEPWPRAPGELVRSVIEIDYDTGSRRWEKVRQNEGREQRSVQIVNGRHAWDDIGKRVSPSAFAAEERWLQIWMTPHGFLRAALQREDSLEIERIEAGSTKFSLTLRDRLRLEGWIDSHGRIGRVLTWVGDTDAVFGVLGDMPVETLYSDYEEFGAVVFPRRVVQKWGGFPVLELTLEGVEPNARVEIEVPVEILDGSAQPFRGTVQVEEVAEGVLHVTGAWWHSVAIEFADHLVVVEAPFTSERASAVLEVLRDRFPGKKVRYVVNTHHHFDHSGGLRVYAEHGATIFTHEANLAFFNQVSKAPRRLAPDGLAKAGRIAEFRPVGDRLILSDGTRQLELHHLRGSSHAAGLLIAYLPNEKVLIEADIFDPVGPDPQPETIPNPEALNLYENIERLGLDVQTIVPIHGRPVSIGELARWAGRVPSRPTRSHSD